MEHISKKISLVKIRSYSPSMINAFNSKSGNFDNVISMQNGNYGMIPTDIELPSNLVSLISEQTDIYINISTKNNNDRTVYGDIFNIEEKSEVNFEVIKSKIDGNAEINYYYIFENNIYSNQITPLSIYSDLSNNATLHKFMTFNHLQEWFLFFKKYFTLLTVDKSKMIKYPSYLEYLLKEKGLTKSDADKINTLDNTFNSRGGEVMYNFLKDYIFINFPTTIEGNDGIKQIIGKKVPYFMSYPQVLQWKSIFKKYNDYGFNSINENSINVSFINGNSFLSSYTVSQVCCTYNEYEEMGGKDMYDWLQTKKYSGLSEDLQLNTSTLHVPILLTQAISNLGEETPLSEEWVEGRTYNNGEIFTYIEDCYQVSGNNGYSYDNCLKEFSIDGVFNRLNISGNNNSFINRYFTYNENNGYISIPNRWNVGIKYILNNGTCFLIDNVVYKQFQNDYIVIENQSKNSYYKVEYLNNRQSYCEINGIKYLGDDKNIILRNVGNCNGNNLSNKISPILKNGSFIDYNNELFMSINGEITIDVVYNSYDAFFLYNGEALMVNGNTVDSLDLGSKIETTLEMDKVENLSIDSYYVDRTNNYVYVIKKYTIYDSFIGSGTTESKLDEFSPLNNVCDLAGNYLKGVFLTSLDKKYPSEGDILKIPYVCYSTNSLSLTDNTYSADGLTESCYYLFGNILTDIKFYRSTADGGMETLLNQNELYETSKNWTKYDYYVKFNYVMGGIIRQIKPDGSADFHYEWIGNIPSESSNIDYHTGIIYEELRKLDLKSEKYYINSQDFQTVFYVDVLDSNEIEYINDNEQAFVNKASFYYYKLENNENSFIFDKGYMNSPTFRQEYNIGNSSLKKVDSNIYIDRGNASSFTRQFALGECRTFESLKRYQNGSLKIINNNDTNTF